VNKFEEQGRVRFLDYDEETALMAELSEPLRTMVLSGIHTGLRLKSEALKLTWGDLSLERGTVTVDAAYAKNKETRTVKLNSTIRAALSQKKRGGCDDYVFGKPDGGHYTSIRTAFNNAVDRAKLEGVTVHVLRHTFASRLVMAGVDLPTVQKLGCWKTLDMVLRYAHLSPSHLDAAVEKIAKNSTTLSTTHTKEAPADVAINA
jgi:integrase